MSHSLFHSDKVAWSLLPPDKATWHQSLGRDSSCQCSSCENITLLPPDLFTGLPSKRGVNCSKVKILIRASFIWDPKFIIPVLHTRLPSAALSRNVCIIEIFLIFLYVKLYTWTFIKEYIDIWEALEHLCPVKVHFRQRIPTVIDYLSSLQLLSAYIRHNLIKIS